MKSFTIGKELKTLLTNNPNVTEKLDNKIFPLVANAGTTFPFLVYRRNGYKPYNNKDYTDEMVSIEIAILSPNYEESVETANIVADALNGKETNVISDIKITNNYEDFSEDTFIQKLNVDIFIK